MSIDSAYPDNHVDESFLNLLLLNAEPVSYSYAEAVEGTLVLTQRLVIVAVFVVAFLLTLDETMSVNTLIIINVATLVGGYGVFVALTPSLASGRWRSMVRHNAKTLAIVYLTLLIVSPVLKTLTDSFSNDTIWALSTLFMLLHILTAHYERSANALPSVQQTPFSFNAAIFASVLLVSRLPSAIHVFALISFAIEIFALAPLFNHRLHSYSLRASIAVTVSQACGVTGLLASTYSMFLGVAFGLSLLFITFVAPAGLLLIRRYKNTINGPWDEARPSLGT
ncbi:phosphatidylinositol N-acetylglucosaminyltransferase subunit C [Thecamonas trahens ATCC 50062]|uniref:Phosphatidylinositol N-acetylglucosaminyltransferase subunit C n=1 Tax=Thecamonas trahens ATCC 50062 TaxID=461836 RepID=A0A0L0DLU3_THETB|nr:phosphatidylinositol N-acetylglucosaminyltransferase subunit C [Thecamonas trahens ATCC 50062]KNC53011.1 phosphatidylinositol N-acetylglucosaminyltransferase subunit C [Thecamonas trahens ATCC 50062]|eukprot:XP_013754897.1 phosphatidylinositol N-acetylglucosaminyltransferase subunit C [Thecamonas trahens ATCC 50062]